jgi:hypothetical protein
MKHYLRIASIAVAAAPLGPGAQLARADGHYVRERLPFEGSGMFCCGGFDEMGNCLGKAVPVTASEMYTESMSFDLGDRAARTETVWGFSDGDYTLVQDADVYPDARLEDHLVVSETFASASDPSRSVTISTDMSYSTKSMTVWRKGRSDVVRSDVAGTPPYRFADTGDRVARMVIDRSWRGNILTVSDATGAVLYKDAGSLDQDSDARPCFCPLEVAIGRALWEEWDGELDPLPPAGPSNADSIPTFTGRNDSHGLSAIADFGPASEKIVAVLCGS